MASFNRRSCIVFRIQDCEPGKSGTGAGAGGRRQVAGGRRQPTGRKTLRALCAAEAVRLADLAPSLPADVPPQASARVVTVAHNTCATGPRPVRGDRPTGESGERPSAQPSSHAPDAACLPTASCHTGMALAICRVCSDRFTQRSAGYK